MHLFLGRSDIFSVTSEVYASATYNRTHEALAAFIHHVINYVENHSHDLKLFGVPLRFVYIKSVFGVAAAQFTTIFVSIVRSVGG